MSLSDSDRRLLADITSHPGWEVITRLCLQSAELQTKEMARILLQTDAEIDMPKLAVDRAYWKAMHDLVRKTELAVKNAPRATKEV